jgi:rhodanese-related sulfurtransferase
MFIYREEPGMTKLMHSIPWTLALSLAAQAGESEAGKYSSTDNRTVKESVIETKVVKDKAYYESRYPDMPVADLRRAMKKKAVVLVDANGSDSWKEGRLPGALDFEGSGSNLEALLPADKNALIVAYCGGPGCRAWNRAADRLETLGYTNVRHYKGGLQEWKKSGRPLEKS